MDPEWSKSPAVEVGRGNRRYSWRRLMFFERAFLDEKVFLPALNAGVVFGVRGIAGGCRLCGEQSCTSLLARG